MNQPTYFRKMLDGCREECAGRHGLERFYETFKSLLFDAQTREYIGAAVSCGSWPSIAYSILQERRAARGEDADPDRLTKHATVVGFGVRAFLLPDYFLHSVKHSRRTRGNRVLQLPPKGLNGQSR